MPTYVYQCPEGHTKDVQHGMDETPEIRCDECSQRMTRIITPPAGVKVEGGTPKFHR